MPDVERFAQQQNLLETPLSRVIMDRLMGSEVAIVSDPSAPNGAVLLELEPPESFHATRVNGNLRVANGVELGGKVTLHVGPHATLGDVNIRTTEGDVRAAGTEQFPLAVGSISLATGKGRASAEHISSERALRLKADTRDNVTVGAGVFAEMFIVKPDE